ERRPYCSDGPCPGGWGSRKSKHGCFARESLHGVTERIAPPPADRAQRPSGARATTWPVALPQLDAGQGASNPAATRCHGLRRGTSMDPTRKLWTGLALLLISSFAVLLWVGSEVHRQAPPMPELVLSSDGSVVHTRAEIEQGRQVWQSIGGQQLGSIWGHGAYAAPDWGADWMHREAEAILDIWARREHGQDSHKAL